VTRGLSFARAIAFVLASAFACTPAFAADDALLVRGDLLTFARGILVFAAGEALHVRAGVALPPHATLGSGIVARVDRTTHDVIAIDVASHVARTNDIDAADLPAAYLVGTSAAPRVTVAVGAAAPRLGSSGPTAASDKASGVTLVLAVPANTPQGDDVYVATDRSNFSPSEIRMTRLGQRKFTVTLDLPAEARVRYEFTRGTYATIERDRSGGIVEPHVFVRGDARTIEATVARWADLD